jgi:hypothetical protein
LTTMILASHRTNLPKHDRLARIPDMSLQPTALFCNYERASRSAIQVSQFAKHIHAHKTDPAGRQISKSLFDTRSSNAQMHVRRTASSTRCHSDYYQIAKEHAPRPKARSAEPAGVG